MVMSRAWAMPNSNTFSIEPIKFAADNPTLLCRVRQGDGFTIISSSLLGRIEDYEITENTGKEPSEEDWRPLPEVDICE